MTVAYREDCVALAREMMLAGETVPYRILSACRKKYGRGLGGDVLHRLRADLIAGGLLQPSPAETPGALQRIALGQPAVPKTSGITEVQIPPEMLEAPAQVLAPVAPAIPAVVPNGTTTSFQNIQAWMQQNQAEQVILNKDGRCSVLAWHHFNVGGPTNG